MSRHITIVFLAALTSATLGCDTPVQREGRLYPPTTAGKRFNETIQQNVVGSACEPQAREHLEQKQADLVKNVDFLFSRFGTNSAPDADLLDKRIKWLGDHDIEPLGKELAALIDSRKVELQDSLTTLFGDTLFSLPSREQVWNGLLFLKQEDLKKLETGLNTTLSKWMDPRNKESKEASEIVHRLTPILLSKDARLVAETLFSEHVKQLPSEEQVARVLELASRDELRTLLPLGRSVANEIFHPSREDTKEAKVIFERFQAMAASQEAAYLQKLFFGDDFISKLTADDIYSVVEFARRPEIRSLLPRARAAMLELSHPTRAETVELLAIGNRLKFNPVSVSIPSESQFFEILPLLEQLQVSELLASPELEEALNIVRRLEAFTKTANGATLIDFSKRIIQDDATRKALLDLGDVLENTERFSRSIEKFGIGALLGDNLGSSFLRSTLVLVAGTYYGIDQTILSELLDFGVMLYREEVINDLLRLEEIANALASKHPLNIQIAQKIGSALGFKIAKPPRSIIESYLKQKENQEWLVSIIDSALREDLGSDLIRLAQIGQTLLRENLADVNQMGVLTTMGLKYISKSGQHELAKKIYDGMTYFAGNPQSIFLSPQAIKDLMRLNELAYALELEHRNELSQIFKLADDYGFSLDKLTKENIVSLLAFAQEPKHLKALQVIKEMAGQPGFIEDLMRLDEISQGFIADNAPNFELMRKIGTAAGITISVPPRQDIGRFLTFVSNPKNQQAAKSLFEISLDFAMFSFKAQKVFSSLPMPKMKNSTRGSVFDSADQVSEEDFNAAWSLMSLGFEVWSMSPENQCKPAQKTSIAPKDIAGTLSKISEFLTTDNGLKSWLALARRVARDTKS